MDSGEQALRDMIASQEEAITKLNEEMRMREQIMREAVAEVDALKLTLSSAFLRMLHARLERK